MAYKPVISGETVVEVPKKEYEDLIRQSERLAIIERKIKADEYIAVCDLKTILDIQKVVERKDNSNETI